MEFQSRCRYVGVSVPFCHKHSSRRLSGRRKSPVLERGMLPDDIVIIDSPTHASVNDDAEEHSCLQKHCGSHDESL